MFDRSPKFWELIFYPSLACFVALAVSLRVSRELGYVVLLAVCINAAFVPTVYVLRDWSKIIDGMEMEHKPEPQPTRAADTMPQIKAGGLLVQLNQSVDTVSINAIKAFNQHILTQSIGGLPVIMTENYWTKKEAGMEQSRWVKIGGTGPTDWKDMMGRGVKWGAYKVEGGLEKRVINSPRKVGQLAQGYPLPTWDELAKMEKLLVK
jgi:hypothetical protein